MDRKLRPSTLFIILLNIFVSYINIFIRLGFVLLTDQDTRIVVEDDAVITTLLGEAVGAAKTKPINIKTFKITKNSPKDPLNTMI